MELILGFTLPDMMRTLLVLMAAGAATRGQETAAGGSIMALYLYIIR